MLYTDFKGKKISRLGYGVMRMPTAENNGPIDEQKAMELIGFAYENGVNYFDTAYFYHGGKSESFIGKALARYPRDSFYLASKFPGNMMRIQDGKMVLSQSQSGTEIFESPKEVFERQLERCGTDYFDFYLLHNVLDSTFGLYTDEKLGIVDYLAEQKKNGRIKHLGFSSHASAETIGKLLDWRDCFEFVQIQLNYLDWDMQDAKKKYEVITKHGLPVVVMEPVRGGKLASLRDEEASVLKAVRPEFSQAEWGFRFLQELPGILVVLSGMTTMEQLQENVNIFSEQKPLGESDKAALSKIVDSLARQVPCTACRYCCEVCPQGLEIPKLLSIYNEASFDYTWLVTSALNALPEDKRVGACIACGQCKPLCPQGIDIPGVLETFQEMIDKHK